jgi:hypothetical protein
MLCQTSIMQTDDRHRANGIYHSGDPARAKELMLEPLSSICQICQGTAP